MIVEDNTGLSDATSYCTVAFADNYLKIDSNFSVWDSKEDVEKETALEYATAVLDELVFYYGAKLKSTQALDLPTTLVPVDNNVRKAASLLALDYILGKRILEETNTSDISSISVPDFSVSIKSTQTPTLSPRIQKLLGSVGTVYASNTSYVKRC